MNDPILNAILKHRNHISILAMKGKFKNNVTNFCFTDVSLEEIQKEILNLNHKKPSHDSTC